MGSFRIDRNFSALPESRKSLYSLKYKALWFSQNNPRYEPVLRLQDLRQLSDFQQIPMSHLADLLRSNDLKLTHEQEAFETVMRWVDEDREGRKGHLPELLALVRLPQLPIAYLLNHVKKHPLIAVSDGWICGYD
jgi:hypothetical protein